MEPRRVRHTKKLEITLVQFVSKPHRIDGKEESKNFPFPQQSAALVALVTFSFQGKEWIPRSCLLTLAVDTLCTL